jgi:hypothetical protein
MRKRNYLLPDKADMFRCDRQLVEKEMCAGSSSPTCPPDLADGDGEEEAGICATTHWSEWSPCSVSCGAGTRSRSRRYKNHMGRKKCSQNLSQTEACRGRVNSCDEQQTNRATPTSLTLPPVGSIIDMNPIETEDCLVSPWSEWSPCSVSCGAGIRLRSRILLTGHAQPQTQSDLNAQAQPNINCSHIAQREGESCLGEYSGVGGDCRLSREEAKPICLTLPPEQGPCREVLLRYYFHPDKKMCLPFTYGGCKGNRNRYVM